MNLLDLELHAVRLPMKLRFRGVRWREALLIRGPEGWGEFSPFPDYGPESTCKWLAAALEGACAVWPDPRRDRIEVNVTVPAVDPETAYELVAGSGCSTAKVKVAEPGQTLDDDLARVAAARRAVGPTGKVRIDANAAWQLDQAEVALKRLDAYDLEYVEQPVSTIDEMVELRKRVRVPVAADEAVRLASDPMEIVEAGGADLLVLKVQPLAGVARALDVAGRAGLPVVVSSALETSVGIAAGLALAAALEELPHACGLGTVSLMGGDVCLAPLVPLGGSIEVRRPAPDPGLLEEWAADRESESRIMRRFREAAELLT